MQITTAQLSDIAPGMVVRRAAEGGLWDAVLPVSEGIIVTRTVKWASGDGWSVYGLDTSGREQCLRSSHSTDLWDVL
jgi:hypothetical protein